MSRNANPLFDEIDDFLSAKRSLQVKFYAAVTAPDESCLLAYVIERGFNWPSTIHMPCGTRVTFDDVEDIPHESLPCPCGKEGEFVIYYTNERRAHA